MNTREKSLFRKRLIQWYQAHKRPLPWRNTKDPYAIWISEIMLQQTQVTTVIDYYHRFLERFPTVEALANASLDQVMKAWEGLGYYARARNLHKAAQEIMHRFHGKMPDTLEGLLSLPGMGKSTAGAVLSLGYEKPAAILDGNVIRVFARIFRITENVQHAHVVKLLWEIAENLLPSNNVRMYNEALMELGATVCKPQNPLCDQCPVSSFCEAFRYSVQHELPVKSPRRPIPHFHVTAGIIWKENRFLITQRPPKGLLGGLWEFPGGKQEKGETLSECLLREIREELNLEIEIIRHLASVNHAYTHFKITLHVFKCKYKSGKLRLCGCVDAKWIQAEEIENYAFPGADRKIIEKLKNGLFCTTTTDQIKKNFYRNKKKNP